MSLNRTHVNYVLTEFDAGVPPPQILEGLQYRAFLPSINLATIERCLRKNGRLEDNYQPGNAAQGYQSLGAVSNNPPPPTDRDAPGPRATTQEARQLPANPAVQTSENDELANLPPTKQWDNQANCYAFSAYESGGKSVDEICLALRKNGYDIDRSQVMMSLIGQGVQLMG